MRFKDLTGNPKVEIKLLRFFTNIFTKIVLLPPNLGGKWMWIWMSKSINVAGFNYTASELLGIN